MFKKIKNMVLGNKHYEMLNKEIANRVCLTQCINEMISCVFENTGNILRIDDTYDGKHKKIDRYNHLKTLFDTGASYNEFLNKFRLYVHDIYLQLRDNKDEINSLSNALTFAENELKAYDEIDKAYGEINIDLFLTNAYKCKFIEMENKLTYSDVELLSAFNKLLYEENIYLKGLYASIDYCKNLKNKSKPLYRQLYDYFLTDTGKSEVKIPDGENK